VVKPGSEVVKLRKGGIQACSIHKKSYDFQRYNSYYFAEKQFSITFAAFAKASAAEGR
jgi:hypothetical protein